MNTAIVQSGTQAKSKGFTLIEIIVGLVISSTALAIVATVIFPQFIRSVDPMFQVRAVELAQSLVDDAMSKRYDELTPVGGQPICAPCTAAAALGAEAGDGEVNRSDFDDFDDFDLFCVAGGVSVQNVFGASLTNITDYAGYTVRSCVTYDGNFDGTDDSDISAKRIDITVTPPQPASPVSISAFRANY